MALNIRKSDRTVLIEGAEAGRGMVLDCLNLKTIPPKKRAFYENRLVIWQAKIDSFTAMTEDDATRFFNARAV